MTSYPQAQLTIPLDIPDVDIINTKIQRDGKLFIEVESRSETTKCGICKQAINTNYGHGQKITLRHLPILNYETYIHLRPKRGRFFRDSRDRPIWGARTSCQTANGKLCQWSER